MIPYTVYKEEIYAEESQVQRGTYICPRKPHSNPANSVGKELPQFQRKWVNNGKIFVRKYNHSRSITILSDRDLIKLIEP